MDDRRLLGKREKSKYLFGDLNIDKLAIDLDHDLIKDTRKHAAVSELNHNALSTQGQNSQPGQGNQSGALFKHQSHLNNNNIHFEEGSLLYRIRNPSHFRTYYDEYTMKNKMDMCMKMTIDQSDIQFKEGDVVEIEDKRYRYHSDLLFEILEDITIDELHEI